MLVVVMIAVPAIGGQNMVVVAAAGCSDVVAIIAIANCSLVKVTFHLMVK